MRSRIPKLICLFGFVACCLSMMLMLPDIADAQTYRVECSNGSCRLVPTGPTSTYSVTTYASPAYSVPVTTYVAPPVYVAPARPAYSYGVSVGVYRAPTYYAPRPVYRPYARPVYFGVATVSSCGNPLCGCVNCPCGPSCACGY